MKGKAWVLLVVLLAVLVTAIPALAGAPAGGTVVEGVSVPGGVSLGDSRAQVAEAWGQPYACQDMAHFDGRRGTDGICEFDVDGGGRVTAYYFAVDGDLAHGTADDVLTSVRWPQSVSEWVTTAGVNTTLALNDPQAVIEAYPNAEVTYNGSYVYQIQDRTLGITIYRPFDFYGGFTTVSMSISMPSDSAPQPAHYSTIAAIDLNGAKIKRERQLTGAVLVHDWQDQPAENAVVSARWFLADGRQQTAEAVTDRTGYAQFELTGRLERGTYYLYIDDVDLADHIWNYTAGRSASMVLK